MHLRKYAITLISLFACVGLVIACAGGWWTIEETTNYTPELFVDTAYKPFYYSPDMFYYSINHDEMQNERFNSKVTSDWYNYLDKKYPESEISSLLFKTFAGTPDSLLKPSTIPARFANSPLLKQKDKKVTDFLTYLKLAKQAEVFALRNEDDWYYYDDKPRKKRESTKEFCNVLSVAYQKSKDKFIKQRLWFQVVRAYFFNSDYGNCVATFNNNASAEKNTMYYRSMSYAAGALKKKGEIAKANYFYSLVYNGCDELKTTAHYSFKPQEEKDWQQTLALCLNTDEKCTLWQMLGVFYKDEVRSIEEILKLDAASPKLDLLISRAVNKIETELFSSTVAYESTAYSNTKEAKEKLEELKKVLREAIKKGTVKKTWQWHLALGYLQTLSGEFTAAKENYNLASKSAAGNKLVQEEARLLNLVNSVSEVKKLDEATENKFLTEFKWLETADNALRKNAIGVWIKTVMSKKYKDQNDFLKAQFYVTTSDYYTSDKDLHAMQSFLLKTKKTPYEQYCQSIYKLGVEDLYEFEAVNKTLEDKTDEAIALFEKAPGAAAGNLLSNPFNGGIKDCHDCDHALEQKTKFTKLSTLKKIKEMKEKLAADPYNNALLLGNAFYSINFYGSSRMFYDCKIMSAESSAIDMIDSIFVKRLTNMTVPKKYYNMALAAAKTDEQKAKCLYMLSKCERNEWYNQGNGNGDVAFVAWNGFKELKKYSATKYYKEIINECGYFKKYAGR
ncbi:MAG: hypothetical protein H0W61_01520 [Bacteroidetes bacterium]|nr:hypothetical protein [Bacteroidota bacterium]